MSDFVMNLNNLFQVAPRSINDLTWSEVIKNNVWTATLTVARVGTFTGTGANRKAAREVAAQKAYAHLTRR